MTVIIKDQKVWFGEWDFSTQHRSVAEALEVAQLAAGTLGDDTDVQEPGLLGWGFSGGALWEAGATGLDAGHHGKIRVREVPFSLALEDGSEGSRVRMILAMQGAYQFGDQHGQLVEVSYELGAMGTPLSGNILHAGELSANTDGTAFELGAVASGELLYAALHVFSGSGALDVKVQSASDEAFTTPNDRIAFAQVLTGTARSSEWATPVAGPITDTWWRMTATVPGTRDFAVVMAIR